MKDRPAVTSAVASDIRLATTAEDFAAFAALVTEYVAWFRKRYRDEPEFADRIFGHQSLASELQSLSTAYSTPCGRAFLAVADEGQVCGSGAFRHLADGVCEMKRLFVPARFSGHGIGRRLCNALLASAREDGYTLMRLDTGRMLTEAVAMYESLGFVRCAPFHIYPEPLMREMVFMELPLANH